MNRVNTAVFISGRGSNMEALVKASQDVAYPANITLVVSNVPDAEGLKIAADMGLEALAIDHRPFGKDRQAHEAAVNDALAQRGVQLVALAGYMRILTSFFTGLWADRLVNIHPSLLPKYPGLHTHARALAAGDAEAGCTVHLVTEGVDQGPVIGQARVPVLAGDDETTLAARVLAQEHILYRACLASVAKTMMTQSSPPVA